MLPVVPDFSHLAGPPNFMQAGAFDDDWVNLLFVGRMIPNKRIEDVVRAFHAYKRWFNPRSRLLLVGSHGGFERYLAMLHDFIARIGAADVHMLGHVTNEELAAYYDIADVFLCASEHEGLLRAADGGVPHGRAGAGLCGHGGAGHDGRRRHPLSPQGPARDRRAGRRRGADDGRCASAWSPARTPRSTGCWPGTSAECCSATSSGPSRGPRRATAPVTFDFWDQVRQAEPLEELRIYRPAAFRRCLTGARVSGLGSRRATATAESTRAPSPEPRDPARRRPEDARS